MPKFNPLTLPPPSVRREEKTFKTQDGQEFTLTFQASSGGEILLAMGELEGELYEKWKSGGPSSPGCPPIRVTQTLCRVIARLMVMQVPGESEEESDLFSFTDWAILAQRDPQAFAEVNTWASALSDPNPKATTTIGSGEVVANSSPPSLTTVVGTQT